MSTKNKARVEFNVIVALVVIIILGNIIIKPPMVFHNYGHFGILMHPIKTIKDLYFGWGYDFHSFIFSLDGLQTYFNNIPIYYQKCGIIKATFAYFTQFSPIWAFIPLKLLYDTCVEFMINDDTNEIADEKNTEGADNE